MKPSRSQSTSPSQVRAWLLCVLMAALFIACALFLPATSAQQQPPRQAPKKSELTPEQDTVIKINTNLVQVDAVVKDETGRIVTDLKAEDFEIVENKRAHPVEYCSYIPLVTDRPAATASAYDGRIAKDELGRAIVFLVSNPILNLVFSASAPGGRIVTGSYSTLSRAALDANTVSRFLNKFIETQMGPRDLVSILNAERDLGVLSQFTNNRELLLAASEETRHQAEKAPQTTLAITNDGPAFKPLARQNVSTLDMLSEAIEQTRDLPGRKVIVLISRDLLFNPRISAAEEVRARIHKLTAQANQARIAIYALNPRGVGGGQFQTQALLTLTEETGGKTIDHTNDISIGFSEVLKENQGYYLLGYDPGEDKSAAPHKIKVRVKRPGWKVQSRAVAYSTSSASETSTAADKTNNTSTAPEPMNLAVALNTPFAVREVGLELTPIFISPDGKQASILSFLSIDPAGIETETQADGARSFRLELAIKITGPDGKLLKQEGKGYSFNVSAADFEKAKQRGLPYFFTLAAPQPGYYQVNTAVRDTRSGRVGNASRIVKVANFARQSFAVSSLALSTSAEKRATSDAAPTEGQLFARQRYSRNDTLMYQCYVYYARQDGDQSSRVQVQAHLKRGTEIIARSAPRTITQPNGPVLVVAEEMPLAQIQPGVYTLELTIEDLLRKDAKLTTSAPLEVK